MENKFIVEFSQKKADLQEIVELTGTIDKTDIEVVKEAHRKIRKVVNGIKTEGKGYRDEANAFNKSVLKEEKEYLEILEPVDVELKKIIDDEKELQIMEARKELLPNKLDDLAILEYVRLISDEELLQMNAEEWVIYYQEAVRFNTDSIKMAKEHGEEEANREEREKDIAEKARLQAIEDEKQKQELKKKEEAGDKEKLESGEMYQKFLSDNGYDENTDIIETDEDEVRIYRIVNTMKL